jgi:hypothetical protein
MAIPLVQNYDTKLVFAFGRQKLSDRRLRYKANNFMFIPKGAN